MACVIRVKLCHQRLEHTFVNPVSDVVLYPLHDTAEYCLSQVDLSLMEPLTGSDQVHFVNFGNYLLVVIRVHFDPSFDFYFAA